MALRSTPLVAAPCVTRPLGHYPVLESRGAWGAVVVPAIRSIAAVGVDQLAAAAGCDATLVAAVEAAELRPAAETIERLANAVSLELRVRIVPRTAAAHVADQFDGDLGRVREALAAEQAWRAAHGVQALAPPPEVVPAWDGCDPAPARQSSAWPSRTDFGGSTAVKIGYARSCVLRIGSDEFAARAGVPADVLVDLEAGGVALSMDATEALLNAAGVEQHVRLEVYDTHDDVLHLSALADPDRTLAQLAGFAPR